MNPTRVDTTVGAQSIKESRNRSASVSWSSFSNPMLRLVSFLDTLLGPLVSTHCRLPPIFWTLLCPRMETRSQVTNGKFWVKICQNQFWPQKGRYSRSKVLLCCSHLSPCCILSYDWLPFHPFHSLLDPSCINYEPTSPTWCCHPLWNQWYRWLKPHPCTPGYCSCVALCNGELAPLFTTSFYVLLRPWSRSPSTNT